MKLDHEDPSHRRYLGDDGTYYEVRPQLRAVRMESPERPLIDYAEAYEAARRMVVENLDRNCEREGVELVENTVTLITDRFEVQHYVLDDHLEMVLGDDGMPIPDGDPVWWIALIAEAKVWPPAPVEPS